MSLCLLSEVCINALFKQFFSIDYVNWILSALIAFTIIIFYLLSYYHDYAKTHSVWMTLVLFVTMIAEIASQFMCAEIAENISYSLFDVVKGVEEDGVSVS